MLSPVVLDERSFDRIVAAYDVVVVDFWAHWCRACRAHAPLVERLCAERPDLLVAKIDVDRAGRLADRSAVRTVPTVMRFDGGLPTAVAVGAVPYDRLLALLRLDRDAAPAAPG
jgi:thioredoxin-like negative regulator of GroEL